MEIENKKVLIFAADNNEDLELHYPKLRLAEAGLKVVVAGEKKGETYKSKHGLECKADIAFKNVVVDDYIALVIPGGYAPDKLRTIPEVLDIVRKFDKAKKLIAFICHAGWIPISAKIIKGIQCTSYYTLEDDMVNAGAKWVDKEVVVDKHFISSRQPEDLPAFCKAILKHLKGN